MKVLLSWLREFAPFDDSPEGIGESLSSLGMAVESLDRLDADLDGIVVARVLDLRPHPGADRIQLVDVDPGDGGPLQICCGAFNMSVGDLVPLATLGTVMPGGMEIARRKMRGEWSNGMLCSSTELGLGDDHAGILVLPPDLEVGRPLAEALGLAGEVLYDLEINPNRPDAMSVAGVARDLAAWYQLPFVRPESTVVEASEAVDGSATVVIDDPDLCGRFVARVIRNVTVQPSPSWLADRLTALGMRPINNVVDVSNYVMLELGQPNHAYDLARLSGPGIRVRRASVGETLTTLDEVERTLQPDDLLICDADDRAIGIAGIMGGADTEISTDTTDVLLELAWFTPIAISKTARRLGLRSEASARFEKGTDPEILDHAATRFFELLVDASPADSPPVLLEGAIDARGELPVRAPVSLRTKRLNEILGTSLSADDIARYLQPIGFAATIDGDDTDVSIPSYRPDCSTEIDLVEEVARHHGYVRIGQTVPSSARIGSLDPRQVRRRRLRAALVGLGLSEAMPLPFLAPGDLERAGLGSDGITITNPLVAEESVLRSSLLPGLLKAVGTNLSRRNQHVELFEIGHVFRRTGDGGVQVDSTAAAKSATDDRVDTPLPDEREHVAVARAGSDAAAAVEAWQVIAEALGLVRVELAAAELPGLHPTRTAHALVGSTVVGAVGEVDPGVLDAHGIGERVAWLELDLGVLLALAEGDRQYQPVSRFPSNDIDLAFEVDESAPAGAVDAALRASAGELLVDLELFDVFRGPPVATGRRSLAFRLRLQALDRTLTDAEVADVRRACIERVESTLPATLRS